jgi:hypothetical protein
MCAQNSGLPLIYLVSAPSKWRLYKGCSVGSVAMTEFGHTLRGVWGLIARATTDRHYSLVGST